MGCAQSARVEVASELVAGVAQEAREEHGQEVLGAWQREGSQGPAHLAPEPAAAHHDQALAQLGILIGELHRDAAAERLPDERRPLDAERSDEQIAQPARVGAERVVAERLGRFSVTQESGAITV